MKDISSQCLPTRFAVVTECKVKRAGAAVNGELSSVLSSYAVIKTTKVAAFRRQAAGAGRPGDPLEASSHCLSPLAKANDGEAVLAFPEGYGDIHGRQQQSGVDGFVGSQAATKVALSSSSRSCRCWIALLRRNR